MFNGLPLPKRYYHNGFWLSRYGAVDMLLYLWAFDKCPYWLQKNYVVKTSPVIFPTAICCSSNCEWRRLLYVKLPSSPMRLVHRQSVINALPKNSCFLLSTFVFTVTLSPVIFTNTNWYNGNLRVTVIAICQTSVLANAACSSSYFHQRSP